MSPSEFYPRCPRHQGEELHSQYSYPHLKCSLSEEKSKFVPFNHRLSRALLHRVCLQVRCIPFTLFYILFSLGLPIFHAVWFYYGKGCKDTLTSVSPHRKEPNKKTILCGEDGYGGFQLMQKQSDSKAKLDFFLVWHLQEQQRLSFQWDNSSNSSTINASTQFSRIWLMAVLLFSHALPSIHFLEALRLCHVKEKKDQVQKQKQLLCRTLKRKQRILRENNIIGYKCYIKGQNSLLKYFSLQNVLPRYSTFKGGKCHQELLIRDHLSFLTFD